MKNFKLAIQLHNVRELLDVNFKSYFRELASMGWDGVEFATTHFGLPPEELGSFVKSTGLEVSSCMLNKEHLAGGSTLSRDTKADFEYAAAFGTDTIICSGAGDFATPEIQDKYVNVISNGVKEAAAHGMKFAYHNHAREMVALPQGGTALDLLLTKVPAAYSELDVYWVQKGGQNPVEYINRYASRIVRIHFKDMDAVDGSFTELGRGCVDLKACYEAIQADNCPCRWIIYEQDKCKGGDPMESARISLAYLKKLLNR